MTTLLVDSVSVSTAKDLFKGFTKRFDRLNVTNSIDYNLWDSFFGLSEISGPRSFIL